MKLSEFPPRLLPALTDAMTLLVTGPAAYWT
jgi:hypothetical protein